MRRLLPLALAAILPAAAPATGQDALEILENAARRYGGVDTVCADFEQLLTVTLLGEERASRGELCQRRPNLFAMRFADPEGDAVVADGTHFWIYYASVNPGQVVKAPLDPARGGLDFYREFLDDPAEKYDATVEGEEEVTGRPTVRLHLQPLADRGYRSARVWIDVERATIRRVQVAENNGTVRDLTLDRIRENPSLPGDAFTFRVPPGVQVISR